MFFFSFVDIFLLGNNEEALINKKVTIALKNLSLIWFKLQLLWILILYLAVNSWSVVFVFIWWLYPIYILIVCLKQLSFTGTDRMSVVIFHVWKTSYDMSCCRNQVMRNWIRLLLNKPKRSASNRANEKRYRMILWPDWSAKRGKPASTDKYQVQITLLKNTFKEGRRIWEQAVI
jgi:hypothetical protein